MRMYRSRQYHESKVLITLKYPEFQRSAIPLKRNILIQTAKESHSAIHNASLGIFIAKIGRLYSLQSMFEFP